MDEGVSPAAAGTSSQPGELSNDLSTVSFRIIALAGEARSLAMQAIRAAQGGEFIRADELLERSETDFKDCHDVQTQALTAHARGEQLTVDILLVHAQDHLSMANMAIEDARIFIDLYRRLADKNDHPHLLEE